jgi:hypothetical protein
LGVRFFLLAFSFCFLFSVFFFLVFGSVVASEAGRLFFAKAEDGVFLYVSLLFGYLQVAAALTAGDES